MIAETAETAPRNTPGPAGSAAAPSRVQSVVMLRRTPLDPRLYQIAVLGSLLAWGVTGLDFALTPAVVVVVLATAQLVQAAGTRLAGLPRFDPRSALISSLLLCLLLRTESAALAAAAAALAIGSKFLLRWRGKHLFNPTNFALVVLLAATDRVWVSPGQWGGAAFAAFAVAAAGTLVVQRAARADVTFAFLGAWAAILFARAAWLGDPWAIPLHQLRSGSLLIFAFFMISDPKTTPDSRAGRIVFAAVVAGLAGWIAFGLYQPEAVLWALAAAAPLVPLLDRLLPAARFAWAPPPAPVPAHETLHPTFARGDLR